MSNVNLFIKNLSYNTNDESLKSFFEQIGPVDSARVITDRDSGRSRGFGFVEYQNDDDANKAIEELDGKELDGRSIGVGIARPKEDRPKRDFKPRDGGNSFREKRW